MASYLPIESRDTFDTGELAFCHDLARPLAGAGNRVTLFLVQNASCRRGRGHCPPKFGDLAQSGIEVLAHDFSTSSPP
jgi:hypothetical protein